MPDPDPIREAVLAARERKGYTIAELASRAGVREATLSEWFAGKRTVYTTTAAKVMAVLGVVVKEQR